MLLLRPPYPALTSRCCSCRGKATQPNRPRSAPSSRSTPSSPRPAPPAPQAPAPATLFDESRSIVYEDDRFLVLNKPSGVALQGQYGSPPRRAWDDLVDALKARKESPEVYPVHRLDKATTGTLLLAKSSLHASRLAKQLENHEVQRQYLAVVHGQLKVGYRGELNGRLRVDPDRVRVCAENEGVEAKTIWECLAASRSHSLISLVPSTGRKHQLRVQCAEVLQAPIVGDFKYAPKAPHAESLSELSIPHDHTLLHSSSISFYTWGKNGKRQTITASAPVSPAFKRFCRAHKLALPE
ncbi:hypothetical protein JCM5296_000731 [Sporobolomyces johnsonii]